EPAGPRTADLPATAPAGFDALAADHSRLRDTGRRPVTPSPLAWSETEQPPRQDYFASRASTHQAPASAPGPAYPGAHASGPNQWGRVVPLRPPSLPEPPGALVFEDVIYPLDRGYVVGRNPSGDEAVRSGTAAPLTLPRDRHVSRVHAYVTVEDGVVYVRDAGTSGGTYIAAPGTEQWTRVGDTAVELAPGWRMRLGQKILTHRPPVRPLAAYPRRY
ncbi:FHA domain-containing protein, partial [Nocardia higoensis]|uniref:FHA domain-containing protein n=1 Tax=Nocardia higoensis TaxID=228599 RepID=UPI000594D586